MDLFKLRKKIKELEAENEELRQGLRANRESYAWFRMEYAPYRKMYEEAQGKLDDKNREAVINIAERLAMLFYRENGVGPDWVIEDKDHNPNRVPECFVDIARRIVNRTDETTPALYKPSPMENEKSNQ